MRVRGRITRRGCCATRRDSRVLHSTLSSIWAAAARIVPCGPDQPCDRTRCFNVGDRIGRFSSCFDEGQPYWRDRSRKPYDRWLGSIEPKLPHSIALVEDPAQKCSGPLWVRGGIALVGADGQAY